MEMDRQAGVLLHPTSLPNSGKFGQLNEEAWHFLDWMESAGLKVWQMLPLTQPVEGLSPYQSVSAFAMNPALLPDEWQQHLDEGFADYLESPPHWLDDYAVFMALRQYFGYQSWSQWPDEYRFHHAVALKHFSERHANDILMLKQQQYVLAKLWEKLKNDANARGILLFGDMPIFVAYDSVDVWANPEQFKLDDDLNPTVVTGVPPDYFSETGQRWGNPHYDWDEMQVQGFSWWKRRVAESLKLFDLIRIDHFRGFESCWEIRASEATAIHGHWQKAPGEALLTALQKSFHQLPLVAEDLGIITEQVTVLKEAFNLPGMSVLQFGFNGLPNNPHALNEQVVNSVVYTGTHDNDTTLGWWQSLEDEQMKQWIESQLSDEWGEMPWPLIYAAMSSPAKLMVAPMQDYLALGTAARMNTPGTVEHNWEWQFDWHQVPDSLAGKIKQMAEATNRL